MKAILYTDGSCLGNPGKGGWAFVLLDEKETILAEDCNGSRRTTNNEMELTAFIFGLIAASDAHITDLVIKSDSKYVVDSINKSWADNWIRTQQVNRPNYELWTKAVDWWKYLKEHTNSLKLEWVKAHDINQWNNYVDNKARTFASKL